MFDKVKIEEKYFNEIEDIISKYKITNEFRIPSVVFSVKKYLWNRDF